MAISLKTIAATCGKDVSTVSRALRDDPRVKQETRDEIKSVAAAMGYTPNLAARSLRLGATKTIWFFTSGIGNPMVREAAEAAADFLRDADYDLLLTLHSNEEAVFERLLLRIEQGVCDAAIIVPHGSMGLEQLKRLSDMGYPLAFLDRHLETCDIPVFTTDNRQAARDLVKRCVSENVDGILPLFGGNTVEDARLRGAVAEAERAGVLLHSQASFSKEMAENSTKCLAILGSSQAVVCSFYAENSDILGSCEIVFAVFDDWIGEPFPAKKAYVCEQDFESMAQKAVQYLLTAISEKTSPSFEMVATPYKTIHFIEPTGA